MLNRTAKRYYSSEDEFQSFRRNLKQMPCPHCGLIGALVLNGRLYGYDERLQNKKIIRGRRIFCNNRKARNNGCGGSFCILAADVIKNFSISAHSLWSFLKGIINLPDRLPSFRKLDTTFNESSAYRLWKRFKNGQARIRGFLTRHSPRPKLPVTPCAVTQTIAHLRSVFKETACPIAAFQRRFQVSFL